MQKSLAKLTATILKRLVVLLLGWVVVRLLAVAILAFLRVLQPMIQIRILLLSESRIGEFTQRTDLYLRELDSSNGNASANFDVAVVGDPANEQLLAMYQRRIHIIRSNILNRLFNCNMHPGRRYHNMIKGSSFAYRLPFPTPEDDAWADGMPALSFNEVEEARGKRVLEQMGIADSAWFVCFHARDSSYLRQNHPLLDSRYKDFANSSIANYVDAMRYVTSCGGYALRMGFTVADKLPNLGDPRIIDYASNYRSDFADVYLLAKCKFFVGGGGGLFGIPLIFNVPVVDANCAHMPIFSHGINNALRKRDMFLPRPIYSVEMDRPLTYREIFESEVRFFDTGGQFEKHGLQPLENLAEEILAVTVEMNQRLDGAYETSEEDETLQERFLSLAPLPLPTVSVIPDAVAAAPKHAPLPLTPSGPRNVRASLVADGIKVHWDAPSNWGASAITHYTVTSTPSNIALQLPGDPRSLLVPGSHLAEGTTYTFTVRTANGHGEGAVSAPSNPVVYTSAVATSTDSHAHAGHEDASRNPRVGAAFLKAHRDLLE